MGPKEGTARKERAVTYCETLVSMYSSVRRQITKWYTLQFQNIQSMHTEGSVHRNTGVRR